MRSLKSGLFAIALAGLFGTVAVVGCSADGGGSGIDTGSDPTAPDPNAGSSGSVVPDKTPDGTNVDAGSTDAGNKKDAAPKAEAGVDAGPPPPVEGTACPTLNAIAQKNCGACGKAETVCLAGDSGTGTWSAYGACGNELVGGCIPGTTVQEACGNCGTVAKTCTQYCAYTSGACTGQPVDSCVPGTIDYTTAGCTLPSTYRNRTCGTACTFSSYSATCVEPINPNKMTISSTVGAVVTAQWTLAAAHAGKKLYGSCGAGASLSMTADYPYVAVEVANPTAQQATIQIYHSGTGGAALDTLIWVYKKTLPPTDATLGMCDFGAADSCLTGDPCGNLTSTPAGSPADWAGIDNVTIPANGKILVYSAGYVPSVVGNFKLNLKVTKFGP